jgi:hypothetical protein
MLFSESSELILKLSSEYIKTMITKALFIKNLAAKHAFFSGVFLRFTCFNFCMN